MNSNKLILFSSSFFVVFLIFIGIYDWNNSKIFYNEYEIEEPIEYSNFKFIGGRIYHIGYITPYFGKVIKWFKNNPDLIQSKGHYTNGMKDGYWQEWYDNSQKKLDGNFDDGEYNEWFINGVKKTEGVNKNSKKNGRWFEWYKNGNRKSSISYKDDSIIVSEIFPIIKWYSNGQKKEEKTSSNSYKKWYKNGNLKLKSIEKDCYIYTTVYNIDGSEKSSDIKKDEKCVSICRCLTEPGNTKWFKDNEKKCDKLINAYIGSSNWKGGMNDSQTAKWNELKSGCGY
jgi:hypothetical protein